jgi:hypothetical protein
MAENKTRPTDAGVADFLNTIEDERKRADSFALLAMMREATGQEPKMWGPAIVGFGDVHYRYESGREGDWFRVGFSPRKANLTLYLTEGFPRYEELLARLGKHTTGKSCLYIKRLADVDPAVLRELIEAAAAGG